MMIYHYRYDISLYIIMMPLWYHISLWPRFGRMNIHSFAIMEATRGIWQGRSVAESAPASMPVQEWSKVWLETSAKGHPTTMKRFYNGSPFSFETKKRATLHGVDWIFNSPQFHYVHRRMLRFGRTLGYLATLTAIKRRGSCQTGGNFRDPWGSMLWRKENNGKKRWNSQTILPCHSCN